MSFTHLESISGLGETVTFATNPSAGELLLIAAHIRAANDLANTTAPPGFLLAGSYIASFRVVAVYLKIADGTETSITVTSTSSVGTVGRRFSVDGTPSVRITPGFAATNATTMTVGPVTAVNGELLFVAAMHDGVSEALSWDGGFIGQVSEPAGTGAVESVYKISSGGDETTVTTLAAQATRQSAVVVVIEESVTGPDYTQRKNSTFDATHTLGTITTATLNAVNVFDHVSSQAAGTVSFTGSVTDERITSGVVDLVLGDGAATQTQTVQVNVFGVVPSNNPAQKDGSALASLTGIQIRVTAGANLNGTQVYYSPTQTTDASGNFSTLDVSTSAAVAADPVLMHVLTAAGDSITSTETVELI
jgi:hypothetical protein